VKPIAFVFAMPMERRPLVRRLKLRRTTIGDVPVHRGRLGDREVVAVATGMGTTLARQGTARLLDAVEVERVVVVGITGAIVEETALGTVIVPEVVVSSATGAEFRPAPLGLGAPTGTMWTTDELLTDPEVLADLKARGVVSLDMETAAIAEVCEGRGVAWSVVRVISDRAHDGSVDAEVFALSNQDGTPNPRAIVRYLVRHPARIPALLRLGRGADRARVEAVDVAVRAVESSNWV
jgi:adenosylhomocysteine nucleosidase